MKKFILPFILLLAGFTAISQNPVMLKDVYPGATGSSILEIVKTTNYTFFNAEDDDPDADRGLYRTDGTPAGTIKLNLTYPGYNSTKAEKLTALGDKVIFAGNNIPNYGEIWVSDGTQTGTIAIERFQPTTPNVRPVVELKSMGSYVYYSAINNSNQAILKRTDGTVAGTTELYNFGAYTGIPPVVFLTPLNNILYFIVYDQFGTGVDQLWRSDGTTAGTYMVYDFGFTNYVASYLMPAGNNLYIMTVVPSISNELWKSDGTTGGTMAVKSFARTNNNNYPHYAAIGSIFYFTALNDNGKELWKTDGTEAGTVMAADINPGAASSNPFFLTPFNNSIYFSATTAAEGTELWKYDGSTASLVKDINPGTGNSNPALFVNSNNNLVFRAYSPAGGVELWITDGTTANTQQVADIYPGFTSSNPALLTAGDPVYFIANNGVNGPEIYKYDNSGGINGLRKIFVNDNSLTGDVFTTAVGNNANPGSKGAPVATISYALSIAAVGDTIIVDAGTFAEQVIIDKGITIKGAGHNLTSFIPPATPLVPAPGPFTEIGLFETVQGIGDVHISDLAINSNNASQNIIIQSGGSVKNCWLQNGGQGIFFRIESTVKTALIENNIIEPQGIGVNCQGSGLTATIRNNTITRTPGYYAGIFAGLDFGPLPQLTIANNTVHNYFGTGMLVNSFSGTYNNNSIVGTGGFAIERTSGNTPVATCNWYGSPLAATVTSKISGIVTYSPWLINGTDNSPANGFQSSPESCAGGPNSFYVNDNNQTGDIFTTATGNNANPGTFNAPFATLNYAISQVPAGATIYVDAGTYVENVVVNKSVTLRGAKYGQNPFYSNDRGNESKLYTAVAFTGFANAIITPAAGNITIDGLFINGDNPSLTSNVNYNGADVDAGVGIYSNNIAASNLTVKNCIVKNCSQYGIGMFRNFGNSTGNATTGMLYTQNHVDNIGSRAMVFGYDVYGSITNNTVTRSWNGVWVSQQILANINLPIMVSGNKIEAYVLGCQSSGNQQSSQPITYSSNEISQADVQTWVAPNASVNAQLTGFSFLLFYNRPMNCWNNKVQGAGTGIYINNSNAALPIKVEQNSFTGISYRYFDGSSSSVVAATCNWFGTNSATAIQAKVFGNVNYTPWLINGTDSDPALGFQPVANACLGQPKYYVNDNSLTGDVFTTALGSNSNNGSASSPFGTLDYAYSIAQPGDTIYVDAGNYNSNTDITLNKSITLLGINYQVSPNNQTNPLQPNSSRVSESRVANHSFIIGASDIRIKGFFFDPGNKTQIQQTITTNDFDNIEIEKNVFTSISNLPNLNILGKVASPLVSFNYSITDNRFEKWFGAGGQTIFVNSLDNVQITSNVFTTNNIVANNARIQTGIVVGSSTGDIFISNNHAYEQNFFINGISAKKTTIAFNTADECNRFAFASSFNVNPNEVEITDNLVTNPRSTGGPVLSYVRNNGTNLSTPNIARIERNTITLNGTGLALVAQALIAPTQDVASANTQVYIRDNKLTITGDFSAQSGMNNYVSAIRFLNVSRLAVVERNEMELTATNYGSNNKFGIGILHTGLQPDASFNYLNNKFSGFPTSVGIQNGSGVFGQLPNGVTVNINNNSFTGDSISINNGTISQTINASCNWYGSSAAQHVLPKISTATVNYIPWLTNGTDNDIATGFQPVPGSCNGTIPSLSFDASTNVSCFGGNNGTISITVSGGSAPYNFNWSRNGTAGYSAVEDPTNLIAGTYDLLMTDANGSTASLSGILITEPPVLTATATGTSTSCVNSASVSASGGTGNYTYLWSNGSTATSISNIPSGTYSVTVTDENGCTVIASCTVTGNPAFNPSISVTNVSCFGGADGILTVTNVNGVAPYQYSIDGGLNFQSSNVFGGLTAGTYTITVKDALGCTGFNSKSISQPAQLVVTLNSVQSTCFGMNTGSVSTSTSGGSPAYSYNWTGPNGFTSAQSNISNLFTGNYTLTVTDSKGCTAVLNVNVPTAPQIQVSSTVIHILCKGEANGSISLNVSGGTGSGFTYQWNNNATTASISNLGVGNYSVVITDIGSGCTINNSFTISQPATAVNISTSKSNATGCNSLGIITVSGSGGTPPYQYSINGIDFVNSGSFTGLYAGSYTVWVKDANGCTKSAVVSITDNGSDEYENNNSKNQAKAISIGTPINARIATAADAADWFKIVTPSGTGNFILNLVHPTATFTFNMYAAGNNTPALVPVNTTASSKEYVLSGNTTYYISVTGGLSYTCYDLLVSPPVSFTETITSTSTGNQQGSAEGAIIEKVKPVITATPDLAAKAYPNPHRGEFKLHITSPEAGMANIELFTVNGQKLQHKTVSVLKAAAVVVPFNVTQYGTIFYRVQVGKLVVTGKVIGAN